MKPDKIAFLVMIIAVLLLSGCGGAAELEDPEISGVDEETVIENTAEAGEAAEAPAESASVFEIINLQENEMAAYVCHDHWHGGIPWIKEGERVSLGTYIEDPQGKEMTVDGNRYSVNARLTEGCEVLSFECHGDHFYLKGEEVGETWITLELLGEDDLYYETPPIPVRVYE